MYETCGIVDGAELFPQLMREITFSFVQIEMIGLID